jgi:hypothetical protein
MDQRGTATVGKRLGSRPKVSADEMVTKALAEVNGQVIARNDTGPLDLSGLIPTTSVGKAAGSLVEISKSKQAEGAAAAVAGGATTAVGLSTLGGNARKTTLERRRATVRGLYVQGADKDWERARNNLRGRSTPVTPSGKFISRQTAADQLRAAGTRRGRLQESYVTARNASKINPRKRLAVGAAATVGGAALTLAGIKRAESGRG